MTKALLDILIHNKSKRIPIWFMRQAGRYLPEYKQVRGRSFMETVLTPQIAAEITLQPVRRFDIDAAIIFSDILITPYALGVDVRFEEGIGPVLNYEYTASNYVKNLNREIFKEVIDSISETISITKSHLKNNHPHVTLIGFVGAPFTVACYMLEKNRDKSAGFSQTISLMYENKQAFIELIEMLTEATIDYAVAQIEAGAEVIKIFDSWAGILGEKEFYEFVTSPTEKIVRSLKKRYPHIPIMGFPRKAGVLYEDFIKKSGVDCVSIDNALPFEWVRENIQNKAVVQGNLDNIILTGDNKKILHEKIDDILKNFCNKDKQRFIFNLGHGCLPTTKIENIEYLIKQIREFEKEFFGDL